MTKRRRSRRQKLRYSKDSFKLYRCFDRINCCFCPIPNKTYVYLILYRFTIQGDPNIPATKVSVKADLTSPLVFTLDEQEHLRTLEEASQPHTEHPLPDSQPFKIPEDCYDRDIEDIPKTCSFRYLEIVNSSVQGFDC